MPRYENPEVPHDVNIGKTSALAEFARLSLALVVFCAALMAAVYFGMRFAAPYIPFRYETALADDWAAKLDREPPSATRQYLQTLAEALATTINLPEGMTLTVHINNDTNPNAFATLGGHIIVTQGLLDLVDSENALAMVLSHEIGHIKHRDPIIAAGSGIIIQLITGILFGNSDIGAVGNTSSVLTQLNFSRAQENAADEVALTALTDYYGHTNGAEDFFKKMQEISDITGFATPEFLNSHPDTPKRLTRIESHYARTSETALTPLPEIVLEARKKTSKKQDNKTCPLESIEEC